MRTLRHIILTAALLLLSPVIAHAQSLTVAWDPNPPTDQVTAYEVCVGTSSLSCNFRQASVPATETMYTFTPDAGVLYYIAVRAFSASGAGSYSSEISVSTPLLSQPPNQSSPLNIAIAPLSLSAIDPDGDSLQFSHNGLPFGLVLNPATGIITGTPTTIGTFTVTIFAADGLVTASRTFVWTIGSGNPSDTTQPALNISSHVSGQTVTTASITLAGTATDSGLGNSGITSVTVNGAAATGGATTGSGTATWSGSVALSSGANTLTVVATDGAGNSRSTQISITRAAASDTAQPSLNITSHLAGQSVSTASITLAGTATDSGTGNSGIASVTVNGAAATGGTATGSGTANWSQNVGLAAGGNTLTVVATDGAGNSRSTQFVITRAAADTMQPSLSIASHTSGQTVSTPSITLSGTATDSGAGGSGVASVTVNGQPATGGTASGNGSANWSRALTLVSGANTITVAATDGAGNTRTVPVTVTYTVPTVPMTAAAISQNAASPQPTGATVTFTASGSGGLAPYEYQWYVQQNGGGWTMLRSWNTNAAYAWTPTQPGTYVMAIWARSAGSTANAWQAYAERTFEVVAGTTSQPPAPAPSAPGPTVPMTSAVLNSSVPSPQLTGTTVTFVAGGTGGTAPYEYQWYLQQNGGGWTMLRSWSPATTYAWTPTQPGNYVMALWARSAGSTANLWQAYTERAFVVNSPVTTPPPATPPPASPAPSLPMTGAVLNSSVPSPQSTSTTVTFVAGGVGGTAPYEYQWYLQQNGGGWTMLRSWSTATTYAWTPAQPGTYVMALWARSAGSTANAWQAYAERMFVINAPATTPAPTTPPPTSPGPSVPMSAAWLTTSTSSPQSTGAAVTFTANGSGGTAPYEYQWYLQQNGGVWTMLRSWSPTTTYSWTPTQPGNYVMALWARSAGSTANVWQAYAERAFVINAPATTPPPTTPPPTSPGPSLPMSAAWLTTSTNSPQAPGATVTFTANGSGGTAPYEYQWYLQQNGGVWTMLRSWSSATTYSWTPTQSGNYVMALWARSAGSTANLWQAYAERTFVIQAPVTVPSPPPPPPTVSVPMTAAWLSTTLLSPQRAGTSIAFHAGGSGGTAPYEYQWYVQRDGGVWQLVQSWSPSATYVLTPTQPGTYVVAIWARSAGSTANVWQAFADRTFVINP